jgi:hypothetical protein
MRALASDATSQSRIHLQAETADGKQTAALQNIVLCMDGKQTAAMQNTVLCMDGKQTTILPKNVLYTDGKRRSAQQKYRTLCGHVLLGQCPVLKRRLNV